MMVDGQQSMILNWTQSVSGHYTAIRELGQLNQYSVRLQTERSGLDPRHRQRIFLLASVPRPDVRPIQLPGVFPGGKARPGRDADHSPHLVPSLRTSRIYTSSPPWCLHDSSGPAVYIGIHTEDLENHKSLS
jgi:hypothetical protein